ncbi:DUF1249 domain-containing protein [Spiribacter onubensis]|uniref:DUF1249 domain-containing protein n=1 Tax=Spiribacter onubensis TaxID=3122420 RepID=A0ABV3S744_9GAMM
MVRQATNTIAESPEQGSFAALMELYENNYIYLRRLVPQLDGKRDAQVSSVDRGPDLHLEVIERCPYTTSLLLTHRFPRAHGEEALPDLQVRIYHDARVAEVLMASASPAVPMSSPEPSQTGGTLAWRWAANRFLNRWLLYCLGEGHGFPVDEGEWGEFRPPARRWAV